MPIDAPEIGTPVIPVGIDAQEVIRRSQVACAVLSDDEDGLKRDILSHAGNRWSLGVASPLRHAELRRRPDRLLRGVRRRVRGTKLAGRIPGQAERSNCL